MRENNEITLHFDLDGVIAHNNFGDYENAECYEVGKNNINKAYDLGYRVVICTARFGTRGPGKQYQLGYELTLNWLRKHGVLFHELHMGKLAADLYVDDQGCVVKSENGQTDWDNNFWPAVEKLNNKNPYGQELDASL
jgi:hypothetical protein